jgi:hypothetical protein
MRLASFAAISLLAIPSWVDACPWLSRPCRPHPVVVYQPCPPPAFAYPCARSAPVVPVVDAKVPGSVVVDENIAPDGWCHIKGRVVFEGDPLPKQKLIPNSKGAYTEEWVVNAANRGVKNVVVWFAPEPTTDELKDLQSRKLREFPSFKEKDIYPLLPKRRDVTINIIEAPIAFIPHLVAVRAGSDLVFLNVSTRPENLKWVSRDNEELNKLVPPGAPPPNQSEFRVKEIKPERYAIEVSSSINPWMRAWVRVFDHPYFTVTDSNGEFEIRFAPRGNLRLFVWQESAGFRNGREGRFGEAIRVPSGRLDLGELKIKALPER